MAAVKVFNNLLPSSSICIIPGGIVVIVSRLVSSGCLHVVSVCLSGLGILGMES